MDAPDEVLKEIREEYERTLILPENKPSPQWMLMPVGLIGSGKTSVIKLLSEQLGLLRISTDEIRKRLKERGYSYKGCRESAHLLTAKYLDLGYRLAIDGNTGSVTGLEYNAKTKKAFPSVKQIFIHINPPEEFILQNLTNSDRMWLYRDISHAVESFLKHKETFVVPNLPFAYSFDPSRKDLSEQIEEGIKALEKALA